MTTSLEDAKPLEIGEWLTLNTASSPTKLKPGETPNASNVWVDEKPGSVITANGFIKVGTIPSGNPAPFCVDFFKTSSGNQLFVVSDNATVWTTLDFQIFTPIITGLSVSFPLRGAIIRDKLWLTNGSNAVRVFDGTTVTVLDGTGTTPNVPKGRYIAYHDERVWMYHTASDRSAVRFTALVDNTGAIITPDDADAWPGDNQLQISEGDADFGTGLILYRGYLYAFKQYSIYRIVGYDEYTYTRVKTRASTGSRFNESLQIKDNLVHLIGVDGIYVFDGEDASRISDIIDPSSASQTAFGFNEIQQPNTNNQFFEVADTAEWNTGTVASNVDVDNHIALKAFDDATGDFSSGALTNVTAIDGELRSAIGTTSYSETNHVLGRTATVSAVANTGVIGNSAFINDGAEGNSVGFNGSAAGLSDGQYVFSLDASVNLTRIWLRGCLNVVHVTIQFRKGGVNFTPIAVTAPASIVGGLVSIPPNTSLTNYVIDFDSFNSADLQIIVTMAKNTGFTVTEIQIFTAAYETTGKFVSRTLDLGATPASVGNFNASETLRGGSGITYFTQTSADGSSWDAETEVINGGAIASTPRRYIRWGANFTSSGAVTSSIQAVYLGTQYISSVHNTGGSIFAWGPFESPDTNYAGQTINFYYRTALTAVLVQSATWKLIVPGGVVSDSISNQFIQFKIEVLGGTATQLPVIPSVTVNWIVGSAGQPSTLQNVASCIWRNRYWLAVAGRGASANNTVLIRGKKTVTFDSPWQLKDWPIVSFARFHSDLYGCSSLDGSIYKLDSGYSKNGLPMDSFFETGDFTFGGFYVTLVEIMVEVDRMGPYSLSVGVSTDQGANWTEKLVDLSLANRISFTKQLNFDIGSDIFRFRLRTNAADQPFQVHKFMAFIKYSQSRGSLN